MFDPPERRREAEGFMSDCLFCRIAQGQIATDFVYEDDTILAFKDIQPQAPVHVVLIPRQHLTTVADIGAGQQGIMDRLTCTANWIARDQGIDQSGYRLVVNCNSDGGQSVFHLHMHLLGGRKMVWPPG